jgi:hypothetical protein
MRLRRPALGVPGAALRSQERAVMRWRSRDGEIMHEARLVSEDSDVEGMIVLDVGGMHITVFAGGAGATVAPGERCLVAFSPFAIDDLVVEAADGAAVGVTQTEGELPAALVGDLDGDVFDAGLQVRDAQLSLEHARWTPARLRVRCDRIDVDFLSTDDLVVAALPEVVVHDLLRSLQDLADVERQRRDWLGDPDPTLPPPVELICGIFDDTALDDYLEAGPVFSAPTDALLRQLSALADAVDTDLSPEELLASEAWAALTTLAACTAAAVGTELARAGTSDEERKSR